jgi:protein TonB
LRGFAQSVRASAPASRIVDVVLAGRVDRPAGRSVLALVVAMAVHIGLLAWATASGESLGSWSAQLAARIHEELGRERVVELTPPPPPPPKPAPPAEPPPQRQPVARAAHPAPRRADSRPPPPAQAGKIIAQEEAPRAPLDLTGDTFVTGTAQAYAGGVTSPTGTNPNAVESREVDAKAPPGEPDRSHPVGLADEDWRCPWPHDAEAEQIDEQVAVVRVIVRPDGTVASARIVRDPGHGFGDAAVACAMRTRFTPAADPSGRPIKAESPPVRVRFTR